MLHLKYEAKNDRFAGNMKRFSYLISSNYSWLLWDFNMTINVNGIRTHEFCLIFCQTIATTSLLSVAAKLSHSRWHFSFSFFMSYVNRNCVYCGCRMNFPILSWNIIELRVNLFLTFYYSFIYASWFII